MNSKRDGFEPWPVLAAEFVVTNRRIAEIQAFYNAILAPLGMKNLGPMGENATLYGAEGPEFLVTKPTNGQPVTHANVASPRIGL